MVADGRNSKNSLKILGMYLYRQCALARANIRGYIDFELRLMLAAVEKRIKMA